MNRQIRLNQHILEGKSASEKKLLQEFDGCAQQLSAIADPVRLRMVMALMERPLSVAEMAEEIGISPFNATHHLRTLKNAGLVIAKRDGKQQMHSLTPGVGIPGKGKVPVAITLNCCTLVLSKLG